MKEIKEMTNEEIRENVKKLQNCNVCGVEDIVKKLNDELELRLKREAEKAKLEEEQRQKEKEIKERRGFINKNILKAVNNIGKIVKTKEGRTFQIFGVDVHNDTLYYKTHDDSFSDLFPILVLYKPDYDIIDKEEINAVCENTKKCDPLKKDLEMYHYYYRHIDDITEEYIKVCGEYIEKITVKRFFLSHLISKSYVKKWNFFLGDIDSWKEITEQEYKEIDNSLRFY